MNNDERRLVERSVNTIRFLAVDAVQHANSGHPGLPMGCAPLAYALWMNHLRHNPTNPRWFNRDRFVLSAGHGSMLLYALLHLTGYDLTLDDIRDFRQWESKTPGHPEFGITPGVEVTTGPLGQGVGNAVGMAIAEAYLAARFNRPGYEVVDHHTYVIAGDGDLMEGVSAEACSLAGHLGLGKLILFYDDNKISLAGATSLSFTENVGERFESYGWHVQHVNDGNDVASIDDAVRRAKEETSKPSLICVRTVIGYGSPHKQGTYTSHGSPLGADEVKAAKTNLGWPPEPAFFVPDDVAAHMRQAAAKGESSESEWTDLVDAYRKTHAGAADELVRMIEGVLPDGWDADLPSYADETKDLSTRKASEAVLQVLAQHLPELIGGTADLNPSTLAWVKGFGDFQSPRLSDDVDRQGAVGETWDYSGRNIHYGVREHAMGAIASGMALHGGIVPFTGTFFTFSDYMRPSIRLAALMGLRVIYVFSHDSIGVGEDGPTHQPVEHLMGLRIIPNLRVIRPADAGETVEAWRNALRNLKSPTALVFTRQNLPILRDGLHAAPDGVHRGGYVLWQSSEQEPEVVLIASGSEVHVALKAGKTLADDGIPVRVVSLPCWEIFDRQEEGYRESVIPKSVKVRIAVEAGTTLGWEHYVGLDGAVVGMDGFGASAPASVLFEEFGVTAERVVAVSRELLAR